MWTNRHYGPVSERIVDVGPKPYFLNLLLQHACFKELAIACCGGLAAKRSQKTERCEKRYGEHCQVEGLTSRASPPVRSHFRRTEGRVKLYRGRTIVGAFHCRHNWDCNAFKYFAGRKRKIICNGQEIRSQGLGKDQKLVSQHFDADVGAPAAPGLGTNDNE